jgi:hypothetical protein
MKIVSITESREHSFLLYQLIQLPPGRFGKQPLVRRQLGNLATVYCFHRIVNDCEVSPCV